LAPVKINCPPQKLLQGFQFEQRGKTEFGYNYHCIDTKVTIETTTVENEWTPWGHTDSNVNEGSVNFLVLYLNSFLRLEKVHLGFCAFFKTGKLSCDFIGKFGLWALVMSQLVLVLSFCAFLSINYLLSNGFLKRKSHFLVTRKVAYKNKIIKFAVRSDYF
jgi:hypothetical protein